MASKIFPGQLTRRKVFSTIALVSLFLLGTFFCTFAAAGQSRVRFLHLASGAGQLEIWVDGRLITGDLDFKQKTDYVDLSSEQHRIICKTKEANPVVLNSLYPFRQEMDYTITVTSRGGDSDLQLNYRIDSCRPSKNLAQVKFTNAVFDSPPTNLSIKYGPTLYREMAFRTSGGCRLLPPGNYLLRLSETATGELIHEEKMEFSAGKRYNIFATKANPESGGQFLAFEQVNTPEETPKIFGVERSVLQLFGAGLIASLVILVLGR